MIRYPRSLMLPTPGVRKWAQQLVRSQNCDRVLFGATAPLGLMSKGLRGAGAEHIVGITHGHEGSVVDHARRPIGDAANWRQHRHHHVSW